VSGIADGSRPAQHGGGEGESSNNIRKVLKPCATAVTFVLECALDQCCQSFLGFRPDRRDRDVAGSWLSAGARKRALMRVVANMQVVHIRCDS